MIVENEFIVNFDENFKDEENLLKDQIDCLIEHSKELDSNILEVENIILKYFDFKKVF